MHVYITIYNNVLQWLKKLCLPNTSFLYNLVFGRKSRPTQGLVQLSTTGPLGSQLKVGQNFVWIGWTLKISTILRNYLILRKQYTYGIRLDLVCTIRTPVSTILTLKLLLYPSRRWFGWEIHVLADLDFQNTPFCFGGFLVGLGLWVQGTKFGQEKYFLNLSIRTIEIFIHFQGRWKKWVSSSLFFGCPSVVGLWRSLFWCGLMSLGGTPFLIDSLDLVISWLKHYFCEINL